MAQLSGAITLGFIYRRIPTTVDGELKLDVPSVFVILETAIESKAILKIDFGFLDLDIDAAVNTAGAEHLIVKAPMSFGDLTAYEIQLDEFSLVPELWFAVPFEAATDVNNLPNSVVVLPGEVMFVKARTSCTASIAGFNAEQLLMLEDVEFPDPGVAFAPLSYPPESQSFAVGSLTKVTWRAKAGLAIGADLGLSASPNGTGVLGYSDVGSVLPGNVFATFRVGDIRLADIQIYGTGFHAVRLGTSVTFRKKPEEAAGSTTFNATISLSGQLGENLGISSSLTLRPLPAVFGGVTISVTSDPFRIAFALDTMTLNSMSASFSTQLNLGAMTSSFGASLSGLERGLTGASARLSLAQGGISVATSVSCAQQGDRFSLTSWANTFTIRLSPAVLTVQATFGTHGLSRAGISVGVAF
jgi:hypothetical protein